MKIAIILGTRPEIIKMSPIIRECEARKIDYFVLHTGQHYSKELDEDMFRDLELPQPKYNLGVGGQPYRKQVGIMVKEISEILKQEKPDVVIVEGDTISVLAGALAANKLGIRVAHHEAGLRSHDTTMLEEVNRVIVDHISEHLFVPTPDSLKNLHQEGMHPDKMFFTGNTIVDAVLQNLELANKKTNILNKLNLKEKNYIFVTAHRAENVDKKERLEGVMNGLALVSAETKLPLIFPIHPRTKNKMTEFGIKTPEGITFIEPVGFLECLQLEKNARLIMTDSGGIQEEACILNVPCVTLRDNTERPETIEYGINILGGTEPQKIMDAAKYMLTKNIRLNKWENPFGDGKAAKRIIDCLLNFDSKENKEKA